MVKCKDCGYLGVVHSQNQHLVSPTEDQRETGRAPVDATIPAPPLVPIVGMEPVCAVRALSLHNSFQELLESKRKSTGPLIHCHQEFGLVAEVARIVMDADRPCDERKKFTPWVPGLLPKEHIDMNILEQQDKRDRRNFIANICLVIAGVVSALVSVISACVAVSALHSASIPSTQVSVVSTLPSQTTHQTSTHDPSPLQASRRVGDASPASRSDRDSGSASKSYSTPGTSRTPPQDSPTSLRSREKDE